MTKKSKMHFNSELKIFLLIFIATVLILVGILLNFLKPNDIKIKSYESKILKFNYDTSFELEDDTDIRLQAIDGNAIVYIKNITYTDTIKAKDKTDLADSLSYQVVSNNDNYNEIYNETDEDNNIYYYLYEDYEKERQVEVITLFKDKNIFIIIYQNDNDEFDLYGTSIDLIVDSLEEVK